MSDAFNHFQFSFFEDAYSARNGLDTEALGQLENEERAQAEDMLIRYLPDTRGVIGLGVLRSRRGEPLLVQLFNAERQARRDSSSYSLVELSKALWQIRPGSRLLAAVTEVLASSERDMQRMDAAMALSVLRRREAVDALVRSLDDPAELVRHQAARSLLVIYDLTGEADVMMKDREHTIFRVMSNDLAKRESGKRDILAAIAGLPISTFMPS